MRMSLSLCMHTQHSRRHFLVASATALAGCTTTMSPPSVPADGFEWQPFNIPGKRATAYTRARCGGRDAWVARANASASLLRRRIDRPVTNTTMAEFSWWVQATIAGADLRYSETADSPVRVVFAFNGDVSRLSMRNRLQFHLAETMTGQSPPYATLMYVWDNQAALESVLQGARSDRVRKIVVEQGDGKVRQWRSYKRPLRADFQRAFGEEPGRLIGIGYLTDSDNTATQAQACYGDVVVHA